MGGKKGKPYEDIKKIKPIDPQLLKMLKSIKADFDRKPKVKKAFGGTIDMSRGQAGYNFKGGF